MHPVRPGSATRSWDPRTAAGVHTPSASWTASRPGSSYNALNATVVPNDETTRHWSFTAFEWVVRDISRLKLFVEDGETTERVEGAQGPATRNDDFEILRESPMMGDGKFKLEIDYGQYETSASMMTAIKCQGERSGERGARAEWVWEHWQERWTFQPDNEVWECPLPTLSELWANPRIQETNSFVICVQIHSPVGPYIPQQPAAFYVPRDLLEGLEASLDNANTGDVRFVCLERLSHPLLSPRRPASAASTASHSPFSTQLTARKRVIYAHSDIISRRSDYFATMLASSFSEAGPGSVSGERKVYNITVEEADFETIYWLLKWVYGNWLLFKENDDPRVAVEGVGEGWSARWLNARGGEWDWKTFMKSNFSDGSIAGGKDDARSVTSGDSEPDALDGGQTRSPIQASTTPTSSAVRAPSMGRSTSSSKSSAVPNAASASRQISMTSPRRAGAPAASSNSALSMTAPSSRPVTKTAPVAITLATSNFPSPSHYPASQRQHPHLHPAPAASVIDPHPHPTPAPPPASALSMYQLAHRYAIPGLASLALEHLMSTITPQSSFPLLLATSVWDELRCLVEDYVVERWDEVSVSEIFEQCCQEVAAGE
ncbi:hypothetical protein HWV62_35005 [Athelia sp. TMB]|nr:hypothetical protein HWV62_35005 [Athelia sp. TMB]